MNKNYFGGNSTSFYKSFINSNKSFYDNKDLLNSNEFITQELSNSKFYNNSLFDVNFKKNKLSKESFFDFLKNNSKVNSSGLSFITHNDFLDNSR
jgi:hypothetical protein